MARLDRAIQLFAADDYWIARSSRAMTTVCLPKRIRLKRRSALFPASRRRRTMREPPAAEIDQIGCAD
jgi:hypothetical protein